MIGHLHFIRPAAWYGLIPLLLVVWRWRYRSQAANNWKKVCDAHLLQAQLVGVQQRSSLWPIVYLILAWVLAVFALAGPAWKRVEQPVFRSLASRVIVLDLSSSMLATDVKPSRLARAKFKVLDILKRSREGQTGLIVFSGEPFVVSPLTTDAATITNQVAILNPDIMPVSGHDVSWALKKAGQLLQQAGANKGSILLVTADAGSQKAMTVARQLHQHGYRVSVLGIGSQQGAPMPATDGGFIKNQQGAIALSKLDQAALQAIARAGGGRYVHFTANNEDGDKLLASAAMQHFGMQAKNTTAKTGLWKDEGRWFVLLLLPIVLLGFRRGVL